MVKHGGNIIPLLTVLEGTITAVQNMQKQLLDYEIRWVTNASLSVHSVSKFKGDQLLMEILKKAEIP